NSFAIDGPGRENENREEVKVLKRTAEGYPAISLLENGDYRLLDLVFSPGTCAFYRDDRRIKLPALESKIVKVLLEGEHCSASRELLINVLYGCQPDKYSNDCLNSTVSRLRGHLEAIEPRLSVICECKKGYELCIKEFVGK
ncbi:MAG: helix-turn-helix domain-containing protein, partial [Parabacteroides sp.]|nr:helix-turn-helix domain-containing protein [Parabacteroides sp.]